MDEVDYNIGPVTLKFNFIELSITLQTTKPHILSILALADVIYEFAYIFAGLTRDQLKVVSKNYKNCRLEEPENAYYKTCNIILKDFEAEDFKIKTECFFNGKKYSPNNIKDLLNNLQKIKKINTITIKTKLSLFYILGTYDVSESRDPTLKYFK